MHAWVEENVSEILSRREGRLPGFEAALVQAKDDGLTRLEIGEDVWASTLFGNSAEQLTRAFARLHALVAPEIDWIPQVGLSRHCSVSALQAWLEPFLSVAFYQTLGLSGDEFAQPIEIFKPVYRVAKARDLPSISAPRPLSCRRGWGKGLRLDKRWSAQLAVKAAVFESLFDPAFTVPRVG